jgi:hypothetical protein
MDTNVIGRTMIGEAIPRRRHLDDRVPPPHARLARQRVRHGACGCRSAFSPTRSITRSRTNIVTSGFLPGGKLPLVADDDRHV